MTKVTTTPESVEAQAKKVQLECRQLIALAAQCPEIGMTLLGELNNSLCSTAHLLDHIAEGKATMGGFAGRLGVTRCC
ncbi:hypothetical protein [Trichormus variabilis]|nr:hypothetical protein [Trichormus variabilis]